MAAHIKTFNTFDINNLVFSAIRKNASGGKMSYINVAGGGKAHFELPVLRTPFGLSSYTDQKTNVTSYSLDISLDDQTILDQLKAIENRVLDHVCNHSDEFLGKKYSSDVIRDVLFKSCVRESKDGKYAPTLKLKILTRDGKFVPEAYDTTKCITSLDTLQKGQRVKTIVDFNQIWVVDNKFGITVRLLQALLFPTNQLKGCVFDDFVEEVVDEEEDADI